MNEDYICDEMWIFMIKQININKSNEMILFIIQYIEKIKKTIENQIQIILTSSSNSSIHQIQNKIEKLNSSLLNIRFIKGINEIKISKNMNNLKSIKMKINEINEINEKIIKY